MSEQDTTTTEDATSEETTTEETTTTEQEPTAEELAALADPGKQALDRMKEQREAAKAQAAELKAELDRIKSEAALKDKPAEEQALEKARNEGKAEATAAAHALIVKARLTGAASGKLADPSDVLAYPSIVKLADFTVDENGDVDSDALNEAIADLIKRKPHLAAQKQTRFDGGADQGAKGKDATPPQWTEADLELATDDETVAAKAAGKLNDLLGIKSKP